LPSYFLPLHPCLKPTAPAGPAGFFSSRFELGCCQAELHRNRRQLFWTVCVKRPAIPAFSDAGHGLTNLIGPMKKQLFLLAILVGAASFSASAQSSTTTTTTRQTTVTPATPATPAYPATAPAPSTNTVESTTTTVQPATPTPAVSPAPVISTDAKVKDKRSKTKIKPKN
jgi:hypothetical protein